MNRITTPVVLLLLAACSSEPVSDTDRELVPDPEALAHDTVIEVSDETQADTSMEQQSLIAQYAYQILGKDGFDKGMYWFEELDPANGYARVSGAFEGWYTLVYWHRNDGTDLIGVTSADCGPVCGQSLTFYAADDDMEPVKLELADVLPMNDVNSHIELMADRGYEQVAVEFDSHFPWYDLPQHGTSLMVSMDMDMNEVVFPIMELSWNGQIFEVGELYYEIELAAPYH